MENLIAAIGGNIIDAFDDYLNLGSSKFKNIIADDCTFADSVDIS